MQSAALMMEHNNNISQLDLSNNNMGDDVTIPKTQK